MKKYSEDMVFCLLLENWIIRKLFKQAPINTTAVKSFLKTSKTTSLYSPSLHKHFISPNLCHTHRSTIVKLLMTQDMRFQGLRLIKLLLV